MSRENPYAVSDDIFVAARAPATERAIFLQKTYALLLGGILFFAATLYLASIEGPVRDLAESLWRTSPWIVLIGILGGSFLVHAVAEKPGINLLAFFGFAFLFGLLLAPLVLYAAGQANGAMIISQASIITAMAFIGLTAYVFYSGKDFGFLGGILAVGLFTMFGIAIAGWLIGFSIGIWYSVFGVLLFTGYILYDTSNIMRRYPTTAWVSAAAVLFVDVILLFKFILVLLLNRD